MSARRSERVRALKLSLPVMCGYVFLGTAFGATLAQAGFGPAWALAMSVLVYAGSMQFVMVPLMAAGTSLLTVALNSPRMHEATFRRTATLAGLNPYMVEIANIREQCSWKIGRAHV